MQNYVLFLLKSKNFEILADRFLSTAPTGFQKNSQNNLEAEDDSKKPSLSKLSELP